MKRTIMLTFSFIAVFQSLWAAYEFGAANFDIRWVEKSKTWMCQLTPHDPPTPIEQLLFNQGVITIGDICGCSILLESEVSEGQSKKITFFYFECFSDYYGNSNFKELIASLGNSQSRMPISIKMKNGNKLDGAVSIGALVKPNVAENVHVGTIIFDIQFSDLHCKGEPNSGTPEHETFIAQILSNYNIESFEIGKVKKKIFPDFCTSKTIQAMLKMLEEYTIELNTYFPLNNQNR